MALIGSSAIPANGFSFVLLDTNFVLVAPRQAALSCLGLLVFEEKAKLSRETSKRRTSCMSALSACAIEFSSAVEVLVGASPDVETKSKSDRVTKLCCFDG
jgi:hypothetical protein